MNVAVLSTTTSSRALPFLVSLSMKLRTSPATAVADSLKALDLKRPIERQTSGERATTAVFDPKADLALLRVKRPAARTG